MKKENTTSPVLAALQRLAAKAGLATPLELVVLRLSDGQNFTDLAAEIGCARSSLSMVLHAIPGGAAAYKLAREAGAQAYLERCHKILNDLGDEPSREQIALANAKVALIQWQIARQNRGEFGDAKPELNINVSGAFSGVNFIDAMRRRAISPPQVAPPAEDADYSIEPDGDVTT